MIELHFLRGLDPEVEASDREKAAKTAARKQRMNEAVKPNAVGV